MDKVQILEEQIKCLKELIELKDQLLQQHQQPKIQQIYYPVYPSTSLTYVYPNWTITSGTDYNAIGVLTSGTTL